jgi:hypothetical protein
VTKRSFCATSAEFVSSLRNPDRKAGLASFTTEDTENTEEARKEMRCHASLTNARLKPRRRAASRGARPDTRRYGRPANSLRILFKNLCNTICENVVFPRGFSGSNLQKILHESVSSGDESIDGAMAFWGELVAMSG